MLTRPDTMNDPYEILGVDADASLAEIKKAYRKLARERHPDLDKDNPWAEDEFRTISGAYDILSNAKTRKQYDLGEIDGLGAKTSGGFRNPNYKAYRTSDFKTSDKKKGSDRSNIKINGANVEYSLSLSFLDAAKGGVKHISTTNGKRLKVTVPPGVDDGLALRLKGQGMPGFGSGRAGDALVEISVKPDPMFRRVETDILLDLPVTLPDAVLGAKVEVPTIDGKVTVTIPPASNTGSILRLKGKGLPLKTKSEGQDARGDQYVTLQIVLPKKQDPEFTEFVRTWSEKHAYTLNPIRTDTE